MRAPLLLAVLLAGCKPECGSPALITGPTWQVFGNVVAWETGPTGAPPGFSPVNGYTDWQFEWPDLGNALIVRVDGQPFDATGAWSTTSCGSFTLAFGGEYLGRDGTRHNFSTAGEFLTWDIVFEGSLTSWNETWESPGGEVGTLQASDASVTGRQYAP